VGTASTPTPPGHFWVRERFRITDPRSGYYPFAFGTSDYSTLSDWPRGGVVGIHGPYYAPAAIPGYISHGCIRLPESFARQMWGLTKLGVRVIVTRDSLAPVAVSHPSLFKYVPKREPEAPDQREMAAKDGASTDGVKSAAIAQPNDSNANATPVATDMKPIDPAFDAVTPESPRLR